MAVRDNDISHDVTVSENWILQDLVLFLIRLSNRSFRFLNLQQSSPVQIAYFRQFERINSIVSSRKANFYVELHTFLNFSFSRFMWSFVSKRRENQFTAFCSHLHISNSEAQLYSGNEPASFPSLMFKDQRIDLDL